MKSAEVADAWRRLRENRKKLVGIELAWSGMPRLTSNVLRLNRQFSVICGENGVGKSTLLHTLFHALVEPGRRSESAVFVREEEGAVDYLRVELAHSAWGPPQTLISVESVRDYFSSENTGLRVALFDPAMHVPAILNAIRADVNFAEELEPLGPKIYTPSQVDDLSYIVGRDYENVSSYEIEGYGGLGVFPYFKVVVAGVEYGSEGMGFGELSLLLSYWLISRLPRGSVMLLEEPETFVSPRSQGRFTNIAARMAVDADLMIIATTHSPSIVSKFKSQEITLVSRVKHTVTITSPVPDSVLERRLELVNPVRRIWLVEDNTAARFLRFFLSIAGLSSISDILIVGNNESVFTSASNFRPFADARIFIFGILDGDERSRRPVTPSNIDFLPGNFSPEYIMREFVTSEARDVIASVIGVEVGSLELALAASEGEDVHEWVHAMRAELEVPLDQFVAGVLKAWCASNSALVDAFVERLRSLAQL